MGGLFLYPLFSTHTLIFYVFDYRIDHWDAEREKIVVITDNCLLIFKYDFIGLKIYDYKRIFLNMVRSISMGDFIYPEKSLMP